MSEYINSGGGEQNIAQGEKPIGKQVNNYGVPPEVFAQYVSELGVTDSALTSFFKILEEQQAARSDLDSKLREIAFRHKELLLRFESVTSDDPQVQALKKQAGLAIENGEYDRADALLDQIDERHSNAIHQLHKLQAETAARLEKEQLGKAENLVSRAELQRLQYRYEKSAQYLQEAAAALPEGYKPEFDVKKLTNFLVIQHNLCCELRIGDQRTDKIHHEACDAAVPGVFNLRNIF